MENSDEVRFQHYFISLVEQVAKPLFVDSCEEARSYGLDCNVDLDLDEDGHPRLRLEVGEPGGEKKPLQPAGDSRRAGHPSPVPGRGPGMAQPAG